ncbi:MAG: hypothetical protein SFU91_15315 [Chloroherpetonaceae bacterium]|nr:hypothetical protein [Chloroherpetonaceae bacterium]
MKILCLIFVFLLFISNSIFAQSPVETNPETWKTAQDVLLFEKLFQERVAAFEENPMHEVHYTKERTTFFVNWIEKCPYMIIIDGRLLQPFMEDSENQVNRILIRAYMGGKTVYFSQIKENVDEHLANMAGMESIVRVYRALKKKAPTVRNLYAEKILKYDEEKKLDEYISEMEKIQ